MPDRRQRPKRTAATIAAACALMLIASDAISASTRVCRQLEAELAAASPAAARRYDNAIARQLNQLRLARKRSQQSGCGFSLSGRGSAKCEAIDATIGKMERNLDALQKKRAGLARGSGRSLPTIMAALDANGCREDGEQIVRRPPGRDGRLFEQLFGGGISPPADETGAARDIPAADAPRVRRTLRPDGVLGPEFFTGTEAKEFRTLCVRTCDGYFFPLSPASSRGDFARDRQSCESACPGAEVEVYYHRREGEASESMVSAAADVPYAELAAAWLYKRAGTPRPQGCGCSRPPSSFEIIAGNPQPATASEPPVPAPAAPADPEAAAGGSSPGSDKAGKKIRVVGPVFLPDPEESLDLRVPAPKEVR